jgi:hypothetical protein
MIWKAKMITDEERQAIINEAVEKALLKLPEVVGNLMANHAASIKANREFYEAHPELKDHKEIVVSVLEKLESENPGVPYTQLLTKALPIIKDHLKIKQTVDTKINRPVRQLPDVGAL